MMTSFAMIAGMMPIALATGAGAEVKTGMAWVIIGGLTSSLVLTLVLVPTIFYIMERIRTVLNKGVSRNNKAATPPPAEVAMASEAGH